MAKFIEPIKKAIEDSNHNSFLVSLNYEIIIADNGKSLLHCNYYDFDSLKKLFDQLYQDKGKFLPDDIEINIHVFRRRLESLMSFLSKMGEDNKHVKRIASTISRLDTNSVTIQSITYKLFDDMNQQIFSKHLMGSKTQEMLRNFCNMMEIRKKELLNVVNQLVSL